MSQTIAYSSRKDKFHRISLDSATLSTTANDKVNSTDEYQLESIKKGPSTTKTPFAPENVSKFRASQPVKNISTTPRVTPLTKILPILAYNSPTFPKTMRNYNEVSPEAVASDGETSPKIREYNLPAIKGTHKTQLSCSSAGLNNQSNVSLPFPTSPSHSGIVDMKYLLQKDYMDHNPHFSKFNKSVYALDKRETSRITLSKEFFYYPEQAEINQKFLNETKNLKKQEEIFSVKVLKENAPETIEILKDKSCYLKIYAFDKTFPMSVNIDRSFGSFEIFISKNHQKPDLGSCEYYIRNEHFQVDYSSDPNVRFIYFRIFALERLQMTMTANFIQAKETGKKPKPLPVINLKAPKKTLVNKKKKAYEFFHENMGHEELSQFKDVISEIKEARKMKTQRFGNFRDVIKDNMLIAHDYDEFKQQRLFELTQKEAILFHNNKVNKDHLRIEKEGKKIYSKFKDELKQIEREWKAEEEAERQEKLFFQKHWASLFTITTIVGQLTIMKSQMRTLRILRELKSNSATQIQRVAKTYIYRPVTIRIQDKNDNYQYEEDNSLQSKIMIKLYEAMNLVAVNARKKKIPNSETLTAAILEEVAPITALSARLNEYFSKVIKIQATWQNHMLIFEARVKVFRVCWDQFCHSLIEEETKKKKKKNTDFIAKIKANRLERCAREFVSNKMWKYSKALTLYRKANGKHDNSAHDEGVDHEEGGHKDTDLKSSKLFDLTKPPSKPAIKDGAPNPSKGKTENNSKAKPPTENDVAHSLMRPHFRAVPTRDELKEVFETIVQGIKRELGL